jgi:5-methylcytosine-specific restriction endonuclease McrA
MAFTETLKLTVKRKAHFSCCLCHSLGVEVHHIVPQAEGGPDTEDNAAPLCRRCSRPLRARDHGFFDAF